MRLIYSSRIPLVIWLFWTGLVAYGFYLLWQFGLIHQLTGSDPSRISWIILLLYAFIQLWAGWLAYQLQAQHRTLETFLEQSRASLQAAPCPDAKQFDQSLWKLLHRLQHVTEAEARDNDYLENHLQAPYASGWFVADLMFKLGLIGTVIGFILMLSAITDLKSMDINQARNMLGEMSAGMRLALHTTLAGLACGALTGIQFHLLERSADRLVLRIRGHLFKAREEKPA